ncbi:gcn5-related n-acetyltransferase protein (plasmid) [Ralstonia solanacearum Po82]|uniref:Gcn5-related n-acetyltransferase protein n=1 Tax=Ralstonia solanacearum (strain Po82) TaxID=1031711 RepID=F6G755_RALS8|nr:gcn5-related n-acetyltransferase protein [Ralstonia solanacearum Po82]
MLYTIHRYPAQWIDRWTMRDGTVATVRPILPQDAPLEAALVEGLSSESRYARFLVGGGRLSDETLAAYTQIDYVNHLALVVSVADADGRGERLIADGRFVLQDGVAEFALLVADDWQGKGVGRRLFAMLIRAARGGRAGGLRRSAVDEPPHDRHGPRCRLPGGQRARRRDGLHRAPAARRTTGPGCCCHCISVRRRRRLTRAAFARLQVGPPIVCLLCASFAADVRLLFCPESSKLVMLRAKKHRFSKSDGLHRLLPVARRVRGHASPFCPCPCRLLILQPICPSPTP